MSLASSSSQSSVFSSRIPSFNFQDPPQLDTPRQTSKSDRFLYLDLNDALPSELCSIFDTTFAFGSDINTESRVDCRLKTIEMFYERLLEDFKRKRRDLLLLKSDGLNRTLGTLDFLHWKIFPGKKFCEVNLNFEGSKIVGDFFEHCIELKDLLVEKKWKFFIRYSKIAELNEKIRKIGIKTLPPFPGKKFFNNLKTDFLRKRSLELQNYFNGLMENSGIIKDGSLREWLNFNGLKSLEQAIDEEYEILEWNELLGLTFEGQKQEKSSHFFSILRGKVESQLNKFKKLCVEISKEIIESERFFGLGLLLGAPKRAFSTLF